MYVWRYDGPETVIARDAAEAIATINDTYGSDYDLCHESGQSQAEMRRVTCWAPGESEARHG